jgi:hypothetical protein
MKQIKEKYGEKIGVNQSLFRFTIKYANAGLAKTIAPSIGADGNSGASGMAL